MTADQNRTSHQTDSRGLSHRAAPKRLGMVLGAVAMLALCLTARFSPAQTTMELTRWKEFSGAKRTSQLGGNITGLSAVDRSGYVVLSDGTFAQLSSSFIHTDSPEGKAFYQGFIMYDFKDGSSILAKVDASGEHHGKQVGSITFLSGTGRFKGITGRGTVYSWMPAEWDLYTEVEASYSVPSK
jgi:hypothetical protein